jgi:hypothetical protein
MALDLSKLLLSSLVDHTLDLDAFSIAVTRIYEAACKTNNYSSINSVCDCLCGQGSKLMIRVLVDKGVELGMKVKIISCIRQCALIERVQMDLLRAGLVDALANMLLEGCTLTSEDEHRLLSWHCTFFLCLKVEHDLCCRIAACIANLV